MVEKSGVEAWGWNVRGWDVLQPISSHFSCAPNISGFEDAKIMKQIHSTIDWTPFVYKKTRITPYCHDFCKIDFNCEFFMSLDGFCMLGKFSKNSKIILSHQQSLMSILRTKSKWFCKKILAFIISLNHMFKNLERKVHPYGLLYSWYTLAIRSFLRGQNRKFWH